MLAKITNNSKALQGVHGVEGLVFIDPGKTRKIEIAADYVERAASLPFLTVAPIDPLDHDGDGKKGGPVIVDSVPVYDPRDASEIELIGAMTEDELRDFIERKTGRKSHHKATLETLIAKAREAANG